MENLPAAVKAAIKARGGVAPISLLEIQTVSGDRFYWSDAFTHAPSLLAVVYAPPASAVVGTFGSPITFHPYFY